MDSTLQVPFILANSTINISVTTGLVSNLQAALSALISDHDVDGMQSRISSGAVLSEWEYGVLGLSELLQSIYRQADIQGCISNRSLSDTITAHIGG